jgi:hypothetical protein
VIFAKAVRTTMPLTCGIKLCRVDIRLFFSVIGDIWRLAYLVNTVLAYPVPEIDRLDSKHPSQFDGCLDLCNSTYHDYITDNTSEAESYEGDKWKETSPKNSPASKNKEPLYGCAQDVG